MCSEKELMQWFKTVSSVEKLTHRCDVTFPGFLRRFRLQSDPRLCWVSLRSKTYLTVLVPSLNRSIIDESKLKSVVIWFLTRLAAAKASETRVWWIIAKLLVLWTPIRSWETCERPSLASYVKARKTRLRKNWTRNLSTTKHTKLIVQIFPVSSLNKVHWTTYLEFTTPQFFTKGRPDDQLDLYFKSSWQLRLT